MDNYYSHPCRSDGLFQLIIGYIERWRGEREADLDESCDILLFFDRAFSSFDVPSVIHVTHPKRIQSCPIKLKHTRKQTVKKNSVFKCTILYRHFYQYNQDYQLSQVTYPQNMLVKRHSYWLMRTKLNYGKKCKKKIQLHVRQRYLVLVALWTMGWVNEGLVVH